MIAIIINMVYGIPILIHHELKKVSRTVSDEFDRTKRSIIRDGYGTASLILTFKSTRCNL